MSIGIEFRTNAKIVLRTRAIKEHTNENTLTFTEARVSFKEIPNATDRGKTIETNPTIVRILCNSVFEQKLNHKYAKSSDIAMAISTGKIFSFIFFKFIVQELAVV